MRNPQHTIRADFGGEISNKDEPAESEGMTQRQVADKLCLPKSTVANIEIRALRKMRAALIAAGYSHDEWSRL